MGTLHYFTVRLFNTATGILSKSNYLTIAEVKNDLDEERATRFSAFLNPDFKRNIYLQFINRHSSLQILKPQSQQLLPPNDYVFFKSSKL
ncbi:12217_t:CDS:2 [Ambispora gerdemannii]|uniref:12217_t:CDS:1 n=1 Tax=Ambispora gerdemannii TaxID=144530 RepID=A0A9N8WG34_9GLOM|nr:12217_t:CDS:2 [Ambispora gerdemannii]